ncbi:hypothetical protein N7535_004191 [Penicillium sp. DV-2018c]|nr:hypothetical protein N7535_004191 [Penicillium sp. DV-2018c]
MDSSEYIRRSPETTEAWILGSGTASLASAVYLIKKAHLRPSAVHILDEHFSLREAMHQHGNSHVGYDQFAGCLPAASGLELAELLSMIPSLVMEGQSYLHDIQDQEQIHLSRDGRTCFTSQENGAFKHLPTKSLNLGLHHRIDLIRLLMRTEESLQRKEIHSFFRSSFFSTTFWTIWSTQYARFGFQPWHSAMEFRRAIRQYISGLRSLSVLNCLDLTGYYQYESIHLPLYLFLQSLGVDFQFGIKIRNLETTVVENRHLINRLAISQNGLDSKIVIGHNDIIIATPGSTLSGSEVGTNDLPPATQSMGVEDNLDANWAIWLEAGNKFPDCGNPYTFCTRKSESVLESFTITTEHVEFVEFLHSLSRCTSQAGTMIILKNSNWGLRLCLPIQPVFPQQSQEVRVLWGSALFPEAEGEHVKKSMLLCSGEEIMSEILYYLNPPTRWPQKS